MKTLQLKTLPLLLVELPEGATIQGDSVGYSYGFSYAYPNGFNNVMMAYMVKQVGKLSDLPDEWFEKYVEPEKTFEHTKHYCHYMAQEYAPMCYYREFFYSLLESKEQVYLKENPITHPDDAQIAPASMNWYWAQEAKHKEAESRTFDPERTYIFELKN